MGAGRVRLLVFHAKRKLAIAIANINRANVRIVKTLPLQIPTRNTTRKISRSQRFTVPHMVRKNMQGSIQLARTTKKRLFRSLITSHSLQLRSILDGRQLQSCNRRRVSGEGNQSLSHHERESATATNLAQWKSSKSRPSSRFHQRASVVPHTTLCSTSDKAKLGLSRCALQS